jgi:hypothetical protein
LRRSGRGFQAIAFKAVDLVERAGAEDTQADIFRLGLAGDGTEGGVDAFGELRGLFVFLREQEVDRVCAAAFGGEPADGGGQCVFGGDGAGGLLGNGAEFGGGCCAVFAVEGEAERHDCGGKARKLDHAIGRDGTQGGQVSAQEVAVVCGGVAGEVDGDGGRGRL